MGKQAVWEEPMAQKLTNEQQRSSSWKGSSLYYRHWRMAYWTQAHEWVRGRLAFSAAAAAMSFPVLH
eukprot:6900-Amphidinium_carterae.1